MIKHLDCSNSNRRTPTHNRNPLAISDTQNSIPCHFRLKNKFVYCRPIDECFLKRMSESDVNSRLQELEYYQNVTKKLAAKFDELVKNSSSHTSSASEKVLKPLPASATQSSTEPNCTECSNNKSTCNESSKSWNETRVCGKCSADSNTDIYSPIWLRSRSEKLEIYEKAVREGGRLTEPEMVIPFNDGLSSTSSGDTQRTFAEITKYERDVKRKRMKHRTTKAPPLTHTEELRSLISVQMELWDDYVKSKKVKR